MPATDTYIIKTVTFKATAISGLEMVDFGDEADVVEHNTDGQITLMATFLDNLKGTCRVSSRNTGLGSTANLAHGQVGALVITMQKRAAGKGAVAGQDKVLTGASATIIRRSGGLPHSDRGTLEIEFNVDDPNGSSPWAWS